MMQSVNVAIAGMGCICAAGSDLNACMESLFEDTFPPAAPPLRFAGSYPVPFPVFEVRSPLSFKENGQDRKIFRTSELALAAARESIEDARLSPSELRERRVGVCIGTTVGSSLNHELFYRAFRSGKQPNSAPYNQYLENNPAYVLAEEFDLKGPCQTIVNACSSGTDAIGIGMTWIRSGLCDLVFAGGADELSRTAYNGFISLMVSDPSSCKPFDKKRKGLNLGEGAGILILESEASFMFRTQRPCSSFVLGYGSSCDAYHLTAPRPDGQGLKRAIACALKDSDIKSSDVSFVNVHGTGTRDNDIVESRVMSEEFPGIPFFSIKGATGHTLGAAGAIGAIVTLACLVEQRIPSSKGFETPDPELPSNPVSFPSKILGKTALSQSLAFGGHNAALVLGRSD